MKWKGLGRTFCGLFEILSSVLRWGIEEGNEKRKLRIASVPVERRTLPEYLGIYNVRACSMQTLLDARGSEHHRRSGGSRILCHLELSMHIINCMYMRIEIQNSKTLAPYGRQFDRPPPMLSPRSSHCAFITAKNKFKKCYYFSSFVFLIAWVWNCLT